MDADTVSRLWTIVASLPPRGRTIMMELFAEEPRPYAEVARATGIPIGSLGPSRARLIDRVRRLVRLGRRGERLTAASGLSCPRAQLRPRAHQHRARLHAAVHVELGVDAADVDPDGLLADEQPLRDLPVGVPAGQLGEHLQLAGGEGGQLVVGPGRPRRLRTPRERARARRVAPCARSARSAISARNGVAPSCRAISSGAAQRLRRRGRARPRREQRLGPPQVRVGRRVGLRASRQTSATRSHACGSDAPRGAPVLGGAHLHEAEHDVAHRRHRRRRAADQLGRRAGAAGRPCRRRRAARPAGRARRGRGRRARPAGPPARRRPSPARRRRARPPRGRARGRDAHCHIASPAHSVSSGSR